MSALALPFTRIVIVVVADQQPLLLLHHRGASKLAVVFRHGQPPPPRTSPLVPTTRPKKVIVNGKDTCFGTLDRALLMANAIPAVKAPTNTLPRLVHHRQAGARSRRNRSALSTLNGPFSTMG
jgi:hypothetical protein